MLTTKEPEAYVTFVDDRSAYLVQLQHEHYRIIGSQQPFYIQPADTWKQPNQSNEASHYERIEEKQTSDIFKLNEDCLLHLFKFLDLDSLVHLSEVCKQFQELLRKHCFPRIRNFTVYNQEGAVSMPLAKMRRTLRCIGEHITDLKYTCHFYNYFSEGCRFLNVLAQNIGPNIRRVQFCYNHMFVANRILTIAPILRHLESLEIQDINVYPDEDIDFEELSPNLIELKLKLNMRLIKCCKPWARLQHLSILNNEYLDTRTFVSFVEQNPRLTSLEFDVFDPEIMLRAIAENLPMLQKLTIDSVDSNLGPWNFVHISRLQHLTEINLLTLDSEHLRGIIDFLATFHGLRKISLHAHRYEDNEEEEESEMDYEKSLIQLAKQLPHLEEFALRSVAIVENTLIEFLKFANRLKSIHIHWCHSVITDSVILKIVNVLKSKNNRSNGILSLYMNPADSLGLHVNRNEEIKRYLHISAKCKHIGF